MGRKSVDLNTKSVLALADLLEKIRQDPASFTEYPNILTILKKQEYLAKLNDESRGISASSLNTVKRIALNVIRGGFETLDELRKGALESILSELHKKSRSNKTDKIGLSKRLKEVEFENQLLRQDLLLMTYVLDKSLSQARSYASNSESDRIKSLCNKEQRELLDMLSLRKMSTSFKIEGDDA